MMMRYGAIATVLALAGCGTGGDLILPADAEFARGGGKLRVTAESTAETPTTLEVQVSWTGGSAASYDIEIRGPLGIEQFSDSESPAARFITKANSYYWGSGCVKPLGSNRFESDEVFIPAIWPSPPPPGATVFARPTSDVSTGGWSAGQGSNLWEQVNEGQPHDSDDSFIESGGDPDTSGSWTVKLEGEAPITDPVSSAGHVLHAYHRKDRIGGRAYDMHYELWQGLPDSEFGTLITSHLDWHVGNSYSQGTFHWPLLDSEADAINNYNDLYVRGFAVSDGGGQRRAIRVTIVELEVPEPER